MALIIAKWLSEIMVYINYGINNGMVNWWYNNIDVTVLSIVMVRWLVMTLVVPMMNGQCYQHGYSYGRWLP